MSNDNSSAILDKISTNESKSNTENVSQVWKTYAESLDLKCAIEPMTPHSSPQSTPHLSSHSLPHKKMRCDGNVCYFE